MKKILLIPCLIFLISCSSDFREEIETDQLSESVQKVEPRTNSSLSDIEKNWSKDPSFTFKGESIRYPWVPFTVSSLPVEIQTDHSTKDGWVIIHDCFQPSKGSVNSLIFYNILTGKLRYFYYAPKNTSPTTGSVTFAKIYTSQKSGMLNFAQGDYALALDKINIANKEIYVSNSTSIESKAINKGWNLFEFDVAYDNSMPSKKDLSLGYAFYDKSITLMDISGKSVSTGTITNISHTVTNPYTDKANSLAKKTGEKVKDLFKDSDKNPAGNGRILGSIVSAAAAQAIKTLAKSATQRYDKTTSVTTTYDVDVTSRLEFNGSLSSNTSSNAIPLQGATIPGTIISYDKYFPAYNEVLGVWNLKKTLKIDVPRYHKTVAKQNRSNSSRYNGNTYGWVYYDCYSELTISPDFVRKEDIEINPKVMSSISRYEVSTEYFMVINKKDINKLPQKTNKNTLYYDSSKAAASDENDYYFSIRNELIRDYEGSDSFEAKYDSRGQITNMPIVYNTQSRSEFTSNLNEKLYFVAKVTVTLYPKYPYNEDVIKLTKTFKPEIRVIENDSRSTLRFGGF